MTAQVPSTGGGRFDFDDGGTYRGGWLEGKAHGHGVCTGPRGQGEFAGVWHEGFEVSGVYRWPSGNTYAGEWKDGKRNKLGVEKKGHWVYMGEWTKGLKGRYGVKQSTISGAKYEGTWTTGVQDGYGVETYADDGTYQGQWLRGVRHGYGVRQSATFTTSGQYRAGNHLNETPSSPTTSEQRSLDDKRGRKSRQGFTLRGRADRSASPATSEPSRSRSSSLSRIAEKFRIKRHTSSTNVNSNTPGSPKQQQNHRSLGRITSNGGSRAVSAPPDKSPGDENEEKNEYVNVRETYSGEWKSDKRCGYGISERTDGLKYAGEWFNDKKNGYGVTTRKDGTKEEGKYKDNVLIVDSSGSRSKLFSLRKSKIRDRVDAALLTSVRVADVAKEKAGIAMTRRSVAKTKAEQASEVAAEAEKDAVEAIKQSKKYDIQSTSPTHNFPGSVRTDVDRSYSSSGDEQSSKTHSEKVWAEQHHARQEGSNSKLGLNSSEYGSTQSRAQRDHLSSESSSSVEVTSAQIIPQHAKVSYSVDVNAKRFVNKDKNTYNLSEESDNESRFWNSNPNVMMKSSIDTNSSLNSKNKRTDSDVSSSHDSRHHGADDRMAYIDEPIIKVSKANLYSAANTDAKIRDLSRTSNKKYDSMDNLGPGKSGRLRRQNESGSFEGSDISNTDRANVTNMPAGDRRIPWRSSISKAVQEELADYEDYRSAAITGYAVPAFMRDPDTPNPHRRHNPYQQGPRYTQQHAQYPDQSGHYMTQDLQRDRMQQNIGIDPRGRQDYSRFVATMTETSPQKTERYIASPAIVISTPTKSENLNYVFTPPTRVSNDRDIRAQSERPIGQKSVTISESEISIPHNKFPNRTNRLHDTNIRTPMDVTGVGIRTVASILSQQNRLYSPGERLQISEQEFCSRIQAGAAENDFNTSKFNAPSAVSPLITVSVSSVLPQEIHMTGSLPRTVNSKTSSSSNSPVPGSSITLYRRSTLPSIMRYPQSLLNNSLSKQRQKKEHQKQLMEEQLQQQQQQQQQERLLQQQQQQERLLQQQRLQQDQLKAQSSMLHKSIPVTNSIRQLDHIGQAGHTGLAGQAAQAVHTGQTGQVSQAGLADQATHTGYIGQPANKGQTGQAGLTGQASQANLARPQMYPSRVPSNDDTFLTDDTGVRKRVISEYTGAPITSSSSLEKLIETNDTLEALPELPRKYRLEQPLGRKASLPTVSHLAGPERENVMPRENVSVMSQHRRDEIREMKDLASRQQVVIRLMDIKDWCTQNQLVLFLIVLNLCLAAMFLHLFAQRKLPR